jgi:hypothetical protein
LHYASSLRCRLCKEPIDQSIFSKVTLQF